MWQTDNLNPVSSIWKQPFEKKDLVTQRILWSILSKAINLSNLFHWIYQIFSSFPKIWLNLWMIEEEKKDSGLGFLHRVYKLKTNKKTHICPFWELQYKCSFISFLNVGLLGYVHLILTTWLERPGPDRIFIKM